MAQKTSDQRLKMIVQVVQSNPGQRAGYIAQKLGLSRSSVTRALPAYLLSNLG